MRVYNASFATVLLRLRAELPSALDLWLTRQKNTSQLHAPRIETAGAALPRLERAHVSTLMGCSACAGVQHLRVCTKWRSMSPDATR